MGKAWKHTINPAFVARLERGLMIAARAVEYDLEALHIFRRMDAEVRAARAQIEARAIDCPIERARALLGGMQAR